MLSCKDLVETVKTSFASIKEVKKRQRPISLVDTLMSGYALFSLKYPSLLQFDRHHREDMISHNLKHIFGVNAVPSDTQMRERLDEIEPTLLRPTYRRLFAQCQRSKHLELFKYYESRYLMPLDGTGYFNSDDVRCNNCCQRHHKDGRISYYHQMLSAAIVHPDHKVVIPFAPEPIMKTDGANKNDCERNAAIRFLNDLKREHPHLKLIFTGDGLFSNGPFIKRLSDDDHWFILVAKEGDHKHLFEEFNALPRATHEVKEGKITHRFSWSNQIAINDTHLDCEVNVLEYWEIHDNGKKQRWVWVTNIPLTEKNVYKIMKGGRARHKIENETFNTLKNQGYQFEHNFGHGNKHLSTVFAHLMMLAFFVDQLQQLGCKLFKKALARLHTKRSLWERKRALFFDFFINSIEDLWSALAFGHKASLAPNSS
jgi:hypothetical protein